MGAPSEGLIRTDLWCTTPGADPVFRSWGSGDPVRLPQGPVEGSCGRRGVFESHPARVSEAAAAGNPPLQRQGPGSGGAAAGSVRDLDMAEVRGMRFDDGADVVAVDREVVEIGQQPDV